MLDGIDKKPIIVGADGNLGGGVCPMLAASAMSQKQVGKPFARAWDAYGGARFARKATKRELLALRTMLVASIEAETESPADLRQGAIEAQFAARQRRRARAARAADPTVDLRAAIAEHQAMKERNLAAERLPEERDLADTGERDRTDELSGTPGWAWLRPFRRLDDYERVLEELREEAEARMAPSDDRELAGRN